MATTKTGKKVDMLVKELADLREDSVIAALDQEEYDRVDDALDLMEQVQETLKNAGL
jgi:hypothetical protein